MNRKVIITNDGTTTIQLTDKNECYHSKHGALNEAKYVFIEKGLMHYINANNPKKIELLEVGLGTYLNSLLTFLTNKKSKIAITYTGIEAHPVEAAEIEALNFTELLNIPKDYLLSFHRAPWNETTSFEENFQLHKIHNRIQTNHFEKTFDIVYYDAFGHRTQPEMWDFSIFEKLYHCMNKNAVLVTYCAKGQVRRDLEKCGFEVERLAGPPGKREMLRATKIS